MMGVMNAKVGSDNEGYTQVMGKHGLGRRNENGLMFADCCAEHNIVIGGTIFPHKPKHQATWISPDMRTENQIDHIGISQKFRRTLQDVRVKRGADAATDHHLVVAKLKLKLKRCRNQTPTNTRFNVPLLNNINKQAEYQLELPNRYGALQDEDTDCIDSTWEKMRDSWQAACKNIVGTRKGNQQEWITAESIQRLEERNDKKEVLNRSKT